ncbi:DUF4870 domain-containing protein [Aestuariibacter halophilus]|uniref:DUF4870 domain-containing protein n=1 Tax=Fluctibacter halophilus TaxID=226011 RepID=A0ABS8G8S1_9ALTE|nr:DUF4870 domain-containing protein [Aestuariibacter halophilus]MCC2616982.1 DUF4870 domain-containing protein [Aestuariibacter halophilus]
MQTTSELDAKNLATLVYALQAASFVIGITFIAAIIINYVKQDDVRGTLAESHFRWQIQTFWISVVLIIVGMLLMVVLVGWLVLVANAIWVIYRIVKGWVYLSDGKPMPV